MSTWYICKHNKVFSTEVFLLKKKSKYRCYSSPYIKFVPEVFHVVEVFSKDLSIEKNNSLTKAMLLLWVNKVSGNV